MNTNQNDNAITRKTLARDAGRFTQIHKLHKVLHKYKYSKYFYTNTRTEKSFLNLVKSTKIRLYSPFSVLFGAKWNLVSCEINLKHCNYNPNFVQHNVTQNPFTREQFREISIWTFLNSSSYKQKNPLIHFFPFRNLILNLVALNQIWIVITHFRLI